MTSQFFFSFMILVQNDDLAYRRNWFIICYRTYRRTKFFIERKVPLWIFSRWHCPKYLEMNGKNVSELLNELYLKQWGENTGSRGVLFDRISRYIHRTIVARIDLLLIQIAVRDRTVNMRLCYTSVEILSAQMVGARRTTILESEAFRTRHEVPRVKKQRQGMKLTTT